LHRDIAERNDDLALTRRLTDERLAALQALTETAPRSPGIFYTYGMELKRQGRHDEAAAALQTNLDFASEIGGTTAAAAPAGGGAASGDRWKMDATRHWLAALRGESAATAPAAYVAGLFDSYAEKFDNHLVEKLGYQTPQLIAAEIRAKVQEKLRAADFSCGRCADLGCGTGLMGPLLRELGVAALEGVDLSEKMLLKAAEKGSRGVGYDRLICGDLLAVFRPLRDFSDSPGPVPKVERLAVPEAGVGEPSSPSDSFGLIVAADVLVYVGDLRPTLMASASWLTQDGLLVFSTEAPVQGESDLPENGAGFRVARETGRYVHAAAYVGEVVESCGLHLLVRRAVTLRYNAGEPVRGHIYVCCLEGAS
jgi:predicted TPR repeat methyltransferase